jgi:hypothetical protein
MCVNINQREEFSLSHTHKKVLSRKEPLLLRRLLPPPRALSLSLSNRALSFVQKFFFVYYYYSKESCVARAKEKKKRENCLDLAFLVKKERRKKSKKKEKRRRDLSLSLRFIFVHSSVFVSSSSL